MTNEVLYRLKIDTSGAKPQFEEIKRDAASLGNVAPKIEFKNLTALKSELHSLEQVRDRAFDFQTAEVAAAEVRKVEKEIGKLNAGLKPKESHGFLANLKEKFADIGKLAGGGALFAGATFGLEKLFEAGEKRIKSLEDYRIALRQSGVAEEELHRAEAEGGKIVTELSGKYAKSGTEIRGILTQVAGLGGISVEQSKKVAEIGIAFEQLGVPARAFKSILQGAGGPESAAALDTLKSKFPAIATALAGAGTAGEKVDAVFKGLRPTLDGMKEAADGPLGTFERIKLTISGSVGKIGEALVGIVGPIAKIVVPVIEVAASAVGDIVKGITSAIEPLTALFGSAGSSADGFKTVLKTVIDIGLAPLKLTIAGVGLAVEGLVAVFNAVGTAVSDVGNFLGLVSDIDNANAHAASSVKEAKKSFEEYGEAIGDVDAKIGEAKASEQQVSRLDELHKKTKLTRDEQEELAKITRELGDAFPEATAGINDLSGEFDVNIDKLKTLSKEQEAYASADKKKLIEENITAPTRDLLPALDAQKDKLKELRQELDEAIASGDTDDILELRDAYNEQRDAIKGSEEQLRKNLEVLVKNGTIGKGTTEEIARGMHISTEEAKKLVPVVEEINEGLREQAEEAKKVAESVEGLAKKYDDARAAEEKALNTSKSALKEVDRQLTEARSAGNTELLKQLQERRAELVKNAREEAGIHKAAASEDEKIERELGLAKAASTESAFHKRLAAIDTDTKILSAATKEQEALLTKTAVDEFTKGVRKKAELSESESKNLTLRRIADGRKELDAFRALAQFDDTGRVVVLKPNLSKKGEEAKDLATLKDKIASLTLELSKREVELQTKIKGPTGPDIEKFRADLASAIEAVKLKEIEVGIRPKSDTLSVIQDRINRIEKEIGTKGLKLLSLDITPEEFGKLSVELQKLYQDKLSAQKDYHDKSLELTRTLQDARIADIDSETDRERALLEQKLALDLDYFNQRRALGGSLTREEQELEQLLLSAHHKKLLKLGEKYEEEKFASTRKWSERSLAILTDSLVKASETAKKLSKADFDDKILGFDKERNALEASYGRGEVSAREYQTKLAKLNEDRTKAENDQNGSSVNKFVAGLAKAYNTAVGEVGKYFTELATKYLLDTALHNAAETGKLATEQAANAQRIALSQVDQSVHQVAEIQKTTVTEVGVTTRIGLYGEETAAALATTGAKTGDAVASTVASGVSIGGIFGIAAAIAAGIGISLAIQAIVNSISFKGFAKGGIIAGEGGQIELIQPAKEFAQFASQLVTQVVTATERSLSSRNQPQETRGSRTSIEVTGKVISRGRDVSYQLERDKVSRQSELITSN